MKSALGYALVMTGVIGILYGLSLASLAGWTWVCRNWLVPGVCA